MLKPGFMVLHEIVKDAKSRLETELGPINGGSYHIGLGNVSMLSVACDVQKLCADAIKMAGFMVLHEIVKGVKSKLETELGPINRGSYHIGLGNVNMLSVARDVQKLCAVAIKMADGWMANNSNWAPDQRGQDGPLPPACRCRFEEISSSSLFFACLH